MSDPLQRLKRAAARRDKSLVEYRQALLAARDAGYRDAELARELGVSRQAVRQMLLRV